MQLPREVIVGDRTLELVSDICEKLGFSDSAFVITGPNTYKIAGKKAEKLLADAGVNTNHLIVSSSTMWEVRAAEERIEEAR
ncbi:MAG: NAD(P)-dependent glycerol-1-phosphate dehydrogenase, partial [Candidatus Bathyarchaeota archaeon]